MKVLVEQDNLVNIANSIRNKNGKTDKYKPSEMPTAINELSSGDVVNGIIEQYLAENETIEANTFIEFVVDKQKQLIMANANSTGENVQAILLEPNRVLILHQSENSAKIAAKICIISDDTITIVSENILSDADNTAYNLSAVALTRNQIFITYYSNNYLNGMVCTITENTITINNTVLVNERNNQSTHSSYRPKIVKLDANRVFVIHNNISNNYLSGLICTITENTITAGIDTILLTTANSAYFASITALDANQVFITYGIDSGQKVLNGLICTISENTITTVSNKTISTIYNSCSSANPITINPNQVFIAHNGTSNNLLYGVVCKIENNTFIAGTDTLLSSQEASGVTISSALHSPNQIFVAHGIISGSYYLYGIFCTICDTEVIPGIDNEIIKYINSAQNLSAIYLNTNQIFIAHTFNNYLYLSGTVCEQKIQKTKKRIDGITKSDVTPDIKGEVWTVKN